MTKLIPLTRGHSAIVDDEDYEWLSQWVWYTQVHNRTFYAQRTRTVSDPERPITIMMHREILKLSGTLQCDHIDGNGLNNQRSNLRVVTHRENCQNLHTAKTSKYPGVSYNTAKRLVNRWRAQIRVNGKSKTLGSFPTEELAYKAYLEAIPNEG